VQSFFKRYLESFVFDVSKSTIGSSLESFVMIIAGFIYSSVMNEIMSINT